MFLYGRFIENNYTYNVYVERKRGYLEVQMAQAGDNVLVSAYRRDGVSLFGCGKNKQSKHIAKLIDLAILGATQKNGRVIVNKTLNKATRLHQFTKQKTKTTVEMLDKELVGLKLEDVTGVWSLELTHTEQSYLAQNLPYVEFIDSISNTEWGSAKKAAIVVRSVQEIMMEKEDVSWLEDKDLKYYVIQDAATTEHILQALEKHQGVIVTDTETTGTKINCFGKINSKYAKNLMEYNKGLPIEEQIRADKLVGVIFCVEEKVSYYFPLANRRFENVYENPKDYPIKNQLIEKIKARYTIGDKRHLNTDMAEYVRNTPPERFTSDVIFMERCRDIFEKKPIAAHNGAFEWKVCHLYDIDMNLTDDTMILHQLMYKFRNTTKNSGEPSSLKYLTKVEFGIDQWELKDFFKGYQEDEKGTVRGKKKMMIDFSYMDLDGTRIYAPADGDFTMRLLNKYKADLEINHSGLKMLYAVEVIVACAVGYMEFYGHRIDESQIQEAEEQTEVELTLLECEIRELANFQQTDEREKYGELNKIYKELMGKKKAGEPISAEEWNNMVVFAEKLKELIDKHTEERGGVNLSAPAQVAKLFFDVLKIENKDGEKSVRKGVIKPLRKKKLPDGQLKYPIVDLYARYTEKKTLQKMFFGALGDFMYPGGFIFSSYGQIAAATGRMSCRKPNAQQYPKVISAITVPRENFVMIDSDFSQIEYRVLVSLAQEIALIEVFKDPDKDYHTMMASLMFGVDYAAVTPEMRGEAKSFNFGIPYGMGDPTLAGLLYGDVTKETIAKAIQQKELYFKEQQKVKKYFELVKERADVYGYTLTKWNRRRDYSFRDEDGRVDMRKKSRALRQAGNAVIQGTAADIFKIAVARVFLAIRQSNLLGSFLIINMVHDEILTEVDVSKLNPQTALALLGEQMQFDIQGFPPLFVGAGVGMSWKDAKGKMAEIHPDLLTQLTREVKESSINIWSEQPKTQKEVVSYFGDRVYDFRVQKVKEYLLREDSKGVALDPAIGNLLNLQFTYGIEKESGQSDADYTLVILDEFIKQHGLDAQGLDSSMFKVNEIEPSNMEDDDEVEYEEFDEGDEFDETDYAATELDSLYTMIDESNSLYGVGYKSIISEFGVLAAPHLKVCGIKLTALKYNVEDSLMAYLKEHICNETDDGAMRVEILVYDKLEVTNMFVRGVTNESLERFVYQKSA